MTRTRGGSRGSNSNARNEGDRTDDAVKGIVGAGAGYQHAVENCSAQGTDTRVEVRMGPTGPTPGLGGADGSEVAELEATLLSMRAGVEDLETRMSWLAAGVANGMRSLGGAVSAVEWKRTEGRVLARNKHNQPRMRIKKES